MPADTPTPAAPSPGSDHSVRRLTADIDDEHLMWTVEGRITRGPATVLLDDDDDLTAAATWSHVGYGVAPLLSGEEWRELREGVTQLVRADLESLGMNVADGFSLDHYHHVVRTDEQHRAFTRIRNAYFAIDKLPLSVRHVEDRISEILDIEVRTLEPPDVPTSFGVRVVRPGSGDNNPPHRDAWLKRLRNTVTAYVPLAGSTARSSLTLVPGSHRWLESELERTGSGGIVDGERFSVPAVAGSTRPLKMTRPDPAPGEVLVFSPYLIHGGARNFEADLTRVSMELRFARAG